MQLNINYIAFYKNNPKSDRFFGGGGRYVCLPIFGLGGGGQLPILPYRRSATGHQFQLQRFAVGTHESRLEGRYCIREWCLQYLDANERHHLS